MARSWRICYRQLFCKPVFVEMETVLEKLGTTEGAALTLKREVGGKIRVTSLLWEVPEVILKREVLEIHNVGGSLHIARKVKHYDDWTRRSRPYNPCGGAVEFIDN
jgi:hypothetical protein